tara:strand:- start:1160 stop:2218 length:1059 start_codon:yes stop_codon:yes gene_type:complete
MIKTKPSWMNWNYGSHLDNNQNTQRNASSGSASNEKGAEKSAPFSKENVNSTTNNKKWNDFINDLTNELKQRKHIKAKDKSSELNVVKNIKTYKKISKKISSKAGITDRHIKANRIEVKLMKQDRWKLEEEDKNYATNLKRINSDYTYKKLKNRKLGSSLSLIFNKVAEERMGDKTVGNDKWDIDKIMFRRISKKVITDCKYSREKLKLVLMLDSSPSCKKMADVYSSIATESAKYDDIEMYDAPNGYAHSIYDKRIKKFRELNTDEIDSMLWWSKFNNRVIIYFGDRDGTIHINKSYKYNELHWFYKESEHNSQRYRDNVWKQLKDRYKNKVTMHRCNNVNELLNAARSIK